MFTEILAAGAMGVSVFFAIKAYSLLKDEQAKEAPRPTMLRSIYVFMGFALLMTPMALGIEYARHTMNMDSNGSDQAVVADKLKGIENKTYYVLNKGGNVDSLEFEYAGVTYQLSDPFPTSGFESTHLKLKPNGQQQFLALKNNNGEEITYGYLNGADIKNAYATIASPIMPAAQLPVGVDSALAATGLMYLPESSFKGDMEKEVRKSSQSANRFLIDFINTKTNEVALQKKALKILVQDDQMKDLTDAEYDKLINALSKNGVRKAPWRLYELAQVYLMRSPQRRSQDDRNRYFSTMCAYKQSYEGFSYLKRDTAKYHLELKWYREALTELKMANCDAGCNCTEKNPIFASAAGK